MNQCNNCDGDTDNLKSMQAGEMQVLCEDCKEDLIDGYESGTDQSHDDMIKDAQRYSDGGAKPAAPSIAEEWTVESIREEWNALNVRLPDYLMRRFNTYYKRLDYELAKDASNREFRKDRHYKPLVIALGLDAVQEMDAEELEDALRELETNQIVD